MTSHVNLPPFHKPSNSSSSSLSSTSIGSDSCSSAFGSVSSSSSPTSPTCSSSLSSNSLSSSCASFACCTHSLDLMAHQHGHNLNAKFRNVCNSCQTHTFECLYASLSINNDKRNSSHSPLCSNNNHSCSSPSHCNNSGNCVNSNTCQRCISSGNIHCDMINNLTTLLNNINLKKPVHNDATKFNSNRKSNCLNTPRNDPLDGEPVALESARQCSQVSLISEHSKFNSAPKVQSCSVREMDAKSDSCQMNQLINENKQLKCIKESQALELKAQRLTLQEQRSHIAILEQALIITKSSVEQLKAKLASIQK